MNVQTPQDLTLYHPPAANGRAAPRPEEQAIQAWLVAHFAEVLALDAREISVEQPLTSYGIDSIVAVSLTGELEDWLGCQLSPTLAWDHSTIEALARHLAREAAGGGALTNGVPRPARCELSRLVACLEQLSEEEARLLLDLIHKSRGGDFCHE